ncbi:serine/threonine protein kinase [Niveispirillum sp. BGYR6]|uniref:serine/threonine protein kinase n=1 Tax=Niveispirillum sp. BGYR6 TaxID=2971249 RepID=UPI0022B99BDA|nr:serine/threonine protein kinase [Niveispirillum sp. BGYR6]MDG5495567.1 serine/threonine protein kinase [Niveispirillum sp. BGYR6]
MAASAEIEDLPPRATPGGRAENAHPPVDLGGRCEIMPASPLPGLDSPGGAAYTARINRDRKTDYFAIVTDRPVPARIDMMSSFRSIDNPVVLRLLDWGTVEWTPEGRRRFVLVYERPGGRRVMNTLADMREPFSDDQIVRGLMPTLLYALREMNARGMTCGAIRPTNLFFKEPSSGVVMLGDCLSTPAGYGQPVLLETIERSLAQPSGRGPGTIGDDLYALGVTLLVLHLGRTPLPDMDDDTILRLKMDKGTYPALTGHLRLPQGLLEPLRGLMTDDPKQRWTLSDLDLWLQGRRLSPKQPQVPRRGARPFEFQGEQLMHCRSLAHALARNSAAAAPLIERGDVEKWVRRAVGDETRAELVQTAITSASVGGRNATQEDKLVARVTTALDPVSPIRYRGVAVMPDGLGPALAEAVWQNTSIQPYAELVLSQLPMFWVNCQSDFRPEYVPLIQSFDGFRALLEHVGMGFGIERILYELCPACPCLSPSIRDYYALTPAELLSALDHLATKPSRGRDPVDRHVIGFITTHHKKLNDRLLNPLAGQQDPARRMIAIISILADVQDRFGPARLPNLCGWLVSLMDPVFKRFKNRERRERMKAEVTQAAREGVLEALVRIVDNIEAIRADDKGFLTAMRQYENLTRQIEQLKSGAYVRSDAADHAGKQVAAIVTSVIAGLTLIGTIIFMLKG